MAKWKEDPQGRNFIDEVTQVMELPIYKAEADGEFRPWLKETWGKVEDNYTSAIGKLGDKYDKTGGVIRGDVIIESVEGKAKVFQMRNTGEDGTFLEFLTGSGRKGWIGRGYNNSRNIEIRNTTSNKSLSLEPDGRLIYDGYEIWDTSNFDPSKKENAFSKNTAFNKDFGTEKGTVLEGSALEDVQENLNNKYDKKGGDINGQVNIVSEEGKARTLAITNKGEDGTFIEFITGSGRKGWIGRGYNNYRNIEIRNTTSNKSLSLEPDGRLIYDGYEIWDENNIQELLKERISINGINKNLEIKVKKIKIPGLDATIFFDTAFPKECLGVLVTDYIGERTSGTVVHAMAVGNYTESKFDVFTQYSSAETFIYFAIGY